MSRGDFKRAVRFIRKRLHLHRKQFTLEVGRHLFENIYRSNRAYYRRTGAKETSIAKIVASPGVKVSATTLRMCVHVYLLVTDHQAREPDLPIPELPIWSWDGLWDLEGDPESLVIVAAWAARRRIPMNLIKAVAEIVFPYVESGGRLEDLLVGEKATSRVDTPYKRAKRLSGMVIKWLSEGPRPSKQARRQILELIEQIEREL
ncbi:MAG: hypothetical protein JRG91_12645 [Deltaproteobacteria bacterium]|nr:hypothetical protein [Deltaproteobacteria bacterium]